MKESQNCQVEDFTTLSRKELLRESKQAKRGLRFISSLTIASLLAGVVNFYFEAELAELSWICLVFIPLIGENWQRSKRLEDELAKRKG